MVLYPNVQCLTLSYRALWALWIIMLFKCWIYVQWRWPAFVKNILPGFQKIISEVRSTVPYRYCTVPYLKMQSWRVLHSVVDPGCLSRIPNLNFSIPDPWSRVKKIPDLGSASKNSKNCFYALGKIIWEVHLGSRIRIPNTGAALPFPGESFTLNQLFRSKMTRMVERMLARGGSESTGDRGQI